MTSNLADSVKNLPSEEQSTLQVLVRDLKAANEENSILRQEVQHYKDSYEKANYRLKQIDAKMGSISKYFQDYVDEASSEDNLGKRYRYFLGVLNNSGPTSQHDLSTIIGADVYLGQPKSDQSLSISQKLGVQTLDLSGAQSSESQRPKHKVGQGMIHQTTKMRQKCETFLKRFDEIEEEDRLKRLRGIEEIRKNNMLMQKAEMQKQGSLVISEPGKKLSLNITELLKANKHHRDSRVIDPPIREVTTERNDKSGELDHKETESQASSSKLSQPSEKQRKQQATPSMVSSSSLY